MIKLPFFNNGKVTGINITDISGIRKTDISGIRKGCNLSALLLVIITYKIIQSINSFGFGYRDDDIKIISLFYVEDRVTFAENSEDITNMINRLCLKYGINLNKKMLNINYK